MTNYNLGDFLIRLKNAVMAKHTEVEVPTTKIIKEVSNTLQRAGFISEIEDKDGVMKIKLTVKNKRAVLMDVKLVSKPGLRVYKSIAEIEKIKKPFSLLISTSKGILMTKEAIKERTGGEIIAEIL